MKTYEQYIQLIQKEVDDTSNGAAAVIGQYVTDTYAEVMRYVGQYLQSSISEEDVAVLDQTAYPTVSDASVIHQVAYKPASSQNFRILQQISLEDYKDGYINRPAAIPVVWYLDGDTVNVAPRPNATEAGSGRIRKVYTPNITELTAGQTSILPDRYTKTIVRGATAKFKAWENNLSAAALYESLFQQAIHEAVGDLSNRSRPLSPKFFGRF